MKRIKDKNKNFWINWKRELKKNSPMLEKIISKEYSKNHKWKLNFLNTVFDIKY